MASQEEPRPEPQASVYAQRVPFLIFRAIHGPQELYSGGREAVSL